MMRRGTIPCVLVGLGCCLLAVPAAFGQAVIRSPDGGWVGSVDAFGQLQDLSEPDQPGVDSLFESILYVASTQTDQYSVRVEDHFIPVAKEVGPDFVRVRLEKSDPAFNMSIDVLVQMLDGPSGGAQYDIWFENKGEEPFSLKPFYYADIDASGDFDDDYIQKLEMGFEQSDEEPGNKALWFIGKEMPKSWMATPFLDLRDLLDGGIQQIEHGIFGDNLNDWTTALSWEKVELFGGDRYHISFGLGGPGIPEPSSLGLLAVGGLAVLRRRRR